MVSRTMTILCVVMVSLAVPSATAQILTAPEPPVSGRPMTVTVELDGAPLAGARVVAVYRPGSRVAESEEIGVTPESGTLEWTPRAAGLVRLRAEKPEGVVVARDVGVRFARAPLVGLFVLVAAGVILLGGVVTAGRARWQDSG